MKVAKVNTLNMQGKVKRMGRYPEGRRPRWKKAMVTLTHVLILDEGDVGGAVGVVLEVNHSGLARLVPLEVDDAVLLLVAQYPEHAGQGQAHGPLSRGAPPQLEEGHGHPDRRFHHAVLLGHQLGGGAGGAHQLGAVAGVELDVVDHGAHGNVGQGEGVALLDVGGP